jgi:steroid 5-alpha reductase family enzyme
MTFNGVILLAIMMSAMMALAWAAQRRTGSSGWIDSIWSFTVGLGGVTAALIADGGDDFRRWLALGIVGLWSARLGAHIAARTRGAGEDPRYQALIEEWGDRAGVRLFLFLQVQAACALVLALAVYAAASNPAIFGLVDMLALVIAIVAIAGEAVSDWQLSRFRAANRGKGKVCETGLWAYSRHPNYFFEWLGWCAWPLLALDVAGGHPLGLTALAAPALMYWLLVHVSGIPPLEAHMLRSRGEAFRSLQARVNAFFPGPRRTQSQAAIKEARS